MKVEINNFKDFLYFNKISQQQAADEMEFDRSYIGRFLSGELPYSKKVAKGIEKMTKGKILAREIVGKKEGSIR